jgi:hypothetical protein
LQPRQASSGSAPVSSRSQRRSSTRSRLTEQCPAARIAVPQSGGPGCTLLSSLRAWVLGDLGAGYPYTVVAFHSRPRKRPEMAVTIATFGSGLVTPVRHRSSPGGLLWLPPLVQCLPFVRAQFPLQRPKRCSPASNPSTRQKYRADLRSRVLFLNRSSGAVRACCEYARRAVPTLGADRGCLNQRSPLARLHSPLLNDRASCLTASEREP